MRLFFRPQVCFAAPGDQGAQACSTTKAGHSNLQVNRCRVKSMVMKWYQPHAIILYPHMLCSCRFHEHRCVPAMLTLTLQISVASKGTESIWQEQVTP